MNFEFEIAANLPPRTLFMIEVRLRHMARSSFINGPKWWGVWVGWWFYPLHLWKTWLWKWSCNKKPGYQDWQIRFLGFETRWQRTCYGL